MKNDQVNCLGIEGLPHSSLDRPATENIIIDGVRRRQAERMISVLRIFYLDHSLYPEDPSVNIHCFEDRAGKFLLTALSHAVQTGYTEGVIVLFEEKRAQRLLECVSVEHAKANPSLHVLQQILCLAQNNTHGVADLYKEMFDIDRPIKPSHWIETIQALVLNNVLHTEIEQLEQTPRAPGCKKI